MRKVTIALALFFIPLISYGATFGSNFLSGGTATADAYSAGQAPADALDTVCAVANAWESGNTAYEHWWKYDLGSGITKTLGKFELASYGDVNGYYVKDITIEGSNNDTDWTFIATSSFSNYTSDCNWETDEILDSTAYRYFRLRFNNAWNVTNTDTVVDELIMRECTDCNPPAGTSTIATSTDELTGYALSAERFLVILLTAGFVSKMLLS